MKSYSFSKESKAVFYNLKEKPIQSMLDFDFLAKRSPSIAAIVHPGKSGFHQCFFGKETITLPIYPDLKSVKEKADIFINFASYRSAFLTSKEAILKKYKVVVIVAEDIFEQETKELIHLAKANHVLLIGPATVGGVSAGNIKLGYAGGDTQLIQKSKIYQRGNVGVVSVSGGMLNEFIHMIRKSGGAIAEAIAIGGDRFPGSTLLDHLLRYEKNPYVKFSLCLGEVGGEDEYLVAQAKKEGKLKKPIIMWVSGESAEHFSKPIQYGHAGAIAQKNIESAQAKNDALRKVGIIVPKTYEEIELMVAKMNKKQGSIKNKEDLTNKMKDFSDRKKKNILSSLPSNVGGVNYAGVPLQDLLDEKASFGKVISLLWFKKQLSKKFIQFIDNVLVLCADHGPAVAGAHNAIVSARAGKDPISALTSGLLTMGPRFGGAIDESAKYFNECVTQRISPKDFVDEMKSKGKLIPGVGHLVKNKQDPDKRVEFLIKFTKKNVKKTPYVDFAKKVEKITLEKSPNLILNIDGAIAVCFLDFAKEEFSLEELSNLLKIGFLNGLFAISRSVGILAHAFDQYELGEGLYRHPEEDIHFIKK